MGAISENVAGAIAYLSFVPAIVFLLMDPYRKNSFVRFHSLQCILLWTAGVLLAILLKLVTIVLFFIPVLGPLLVVLVVVTVGVAALLAWVVLLVKAVQGERFKLPLVGDFAEQYAGLT